MGGIRNESANLLFGAFTHLKGRTHIIEQLVQGVPDRTHLGSGVGVFGHHLHLLGDGVFTQV